MQITIRMSLMLVLAALPGTSVYSATDTFFATVGAGQSGQWNFRTIFRVFNESSEEQTYRFHFRDLDGENTPVVLEAEWTEEGRLEREVEQLGQEVESWLLAVPAGSFAEVAVVPQGLLRLGSVRVQSESDVSVHCFLQIGEGDPEDPEVHLFEDLLVREVEIRGTPGSRELSFPVTFLNSTQDLNTAFALVNLADRENEVTLTFRPDTVRTVQLLPRSMMSVYFDEFWQLSFPEIFPLRVDGAATVSADAPVSVTVFRTLQGLPSSAISANLLPSTVEPTQAMVGEEFELQFGETIELAGAGIELTFWNLPEDSRCPIGATCIWEGRAVVDLRGEFPDGPRQFQLISHAGNEEMATAVIGGHSIELKAVLPIPSLDDPQVPLEDYRIRLLVRPLED